jgi:hypothetical protein
VILEVKGVVRVLLDHLEDLDGLCDDLKSVCELAVVRNVGRCWYFRANAVT